MEYMHSRGFIHQDLNPSNILINGEGHALIGDFGCSRHRFAEVTPTSSGADGEYSAPEFGCSVDWRHEIGWSEKVDSYSFGLILKEILRVSPLSREDRTAFTIFVDQGLSAITGIGSRILESMARLIESCCDLNADSRPSFDDILSIFAALDFTLFPSANPRETYSYIRGVRDWQSEHPYHLLVINSNCLGSDGRPMMRILTEQI
jgi:serine/threonine protein kinase